MRVIDTAISDVKIIEPAVFSDERGFFYESFNQEKFNEAICRQVNFVQDNHSRSVKGVLRGLHYQLSPYAQGKLVRCVEGEVYDVAVDLRRSSPSFGQWVGVILSADNKRQLWIPEGFAHGFVTLSNYAEVLYKTTDFWNKDSERSITWNDSDLNINWPIQQDPMLATKDKLANSFLGAEVFE